jgi:Zn finger protein HypA/HybF involved in hydrogenase expression
MFKRTLEDFICEHCGARVKGTGYTNHCPKCLWSKHGDVDPGDRMEHCLGMMEPIAIEGSSPDYRVAHKCTRCGAKRTVRLAKDDSMDVVAALAGRS